MSTLTVRLPDDKHNRLKALAAHKNLSLNNLQFMSKCLVVTNGYFLVCA